jgi:hypothetical protein
MVTPCADGYTVYISAKLDDEHRLKAYEHALRHIESGDFDMDCTKTVQEMETAAHAPDKVLSIEKFQAEIEELKKQRRKINAQIRKKKSQIAFLQKTGFDFMAAAEENYLYGPF